MGGRIHGGDKLQVVKGKGYFFVRVEGYCVTINYEERGGGGFYHMCRGLWSLTEDLLRKLTSFYGGIKRGGGGKSLTEGKGGMRFGTVCKNVCLLGIKKETSSGGGELFDTEKNRLRSTMVTGTLGSKDRR